MKAKKKSKVKKKSVKKKSNRRVALVTVGTLGILTTTALLMTSSKEEPSLEMTYLEKSTPEVLEVVEIGAAITVNQPNESTTRFEYPIETLTASMGFELFDAFATKTIAQSEDGVVQSEVPEVSYQDPKSYQIATQDFSSYFQVGADYTYVNLRPKGQSSFKGNLGGLQGSYEYKPKDNVYAGANFSWKQGNTHGSSGKRSLLYIDAQERLGYTFGGRKTDFTFTLFSGLGYRHYGQKLTPNTGNTLKFRYNEFYVPVGFLADYAMNSWVAMGLDFTWMPQVYPTVSIEPLKGSRWILSSKLPNFFVKVPINFTVTKNKRFHIIVDPFYEHWEDGKSDAVTSTGVSLGLPSNNYNFWGVNLNFLYSF